jgi:hypothetical protein
MFADEKAEREFCDFLEHRICGYLNDNDNIETKGFWCDGVLFNTGVLTTEEKNIIACTVFAGKTGQDEYKLLLRFGKKSLELLSKGQDIQSCVSELRQVNTFQIDTRKKLMQICTL